MRFHRIHQDEKLSYRLPIQGRNTMQNKTQAPTFTRLMFGKAASNWRRFVSSVRRDLVLGGVTATAGFGLFYYWKGLPIALDAYITAATFTFGPIGIAAVVVFLWYLIIAPAELAYEAVKAIPPPRAQITPAPVLPMRVDSPINWAIWKARTYFTVQEFSGILAKHEPSSFSSGPEQASFQRLIIEEIKSGDLPHIEEIREGYDGLTYPASPSYETEIEKRDAIKWAHSHKFDVTHIE